MRAFFELSLVYVIGFFSPISAFILGIGFIVIADTTMGVLVAKKNNDFASKKFYRVFPKFITYSICVITSRVVELLYFPQFPATQLISGLIVYNELISIDEKVKIITGKGFLKLLTEKLNIKRKD